MKYIKIFENIFPGYKSYDITILEATRSSDVKLVKQLIDHGVDLDFQDEHSETALMSAAFNASSRFSDSEIIKKNTKILKMLINAGANLDIQTNYGWTALFCTSENFNISKLLIDAGANCFIENNKQRHYSGKYFFDTLKKDDLNKIKKLYPDKYKEYLFLKTAEKYNL